MTSGELEAAEAAGGFRAQHGLGAAPLGDLIALVEQALRVDVAVLTAPPDEHALTMKDPARGAVFVALARTPHPMRQRSSLAHEVGHLLLDHETWATWQSQPSSQGSLEWSRRTASESRADTFARHLLLPLEAVTAFWASLDGPATPSAAVLSALVQRFLVSPKIAAIQAHGAGLVDTATKADWMSATTPLLATRFGWLDQYRVLSAESAAHRAPQRLLARATEGYRAGVVSVQEIARLRGAPASTVVSDLEAAGIGPGSLPTPWAALRPSSSSDDFSDLDELESAERDLGLTHDG